MKRKWNNKPINPQVQASEAENNGIVAGYAFAANTDKDNHLKYGQKRAEYIPAIPESFSGATSDYNGPDLPGRVGGGGNTAVGPHERQPHGRTMRGHTGMRGNGLDEPQLLPKNKERLNTSSTVSDDAFTARRARVIKSVESHETSKKGW